MCDVASTAPSIRSQYLSLSDTAQIDIFVSHTCCCDRQVDDVKEDGEEDEDEDPCYLRVLEGPQKGQCRVHWWYHPD
eukprot:2774-Eustigmatos_ZCMA.PRE.1